LRRSAIEWTVTTWNPVTGCTKISPGCKHCYAESFSRRLKAQGHPRYKHGFKVTIHRNMLGFPPKWKKPRLVFVNSMSDLFHEEVPADFIKDTFEVMRESDTHQFQILTKRSDRVLNLDTDLEWPPNVWMGVSVENEEYTSRINDLRRTGAFVKFVCFEPLLGPISHLDLGLIDWVIVGGESGPGARVMQRDWVRVIRDKCLENDIPFFFKQWGGTQRKKAGRLLDGRIWDQMPANAAGIPLFAE